MSCENNSIVTTSCPVCHYSLATHFFNGGMQPLATLGWPASAPQAQSMTKYSLDYVSCPKCTHIWNRSFAYEIIPYRDNANRMFNKGIIWQGHLAKIKDLLISQLPKNPTIIDIGCGEGNFVRSLFKAINMQGRIIGFDLNTTLESGVGVEFYPRYFNPFDDIVKFSPDLLIMRHVLEHLQDPADFIDQLAWNAGKLKKPVKLFAEVPCIDRVLESKRLVDFFYEHPSQFTTRSFSSLMKKGGKIFDLAHGYNGEIIYALVQLSVPNRYQQFAKVSEDFYRQAFISKTQIKSQLRKLINDNKKVAIWGGTGKAAAFIHYFDVNTENITLVVDSDLSKVGTYVSKSGHQIQNRDVLKNQKIDILIIPPQWRAKDILIEMGRAGIKVETVLIEHEGRLIEFLSEDHPYH